MDGVRVSPDRLPGMKLPRRSGCCGRWRLRGSVAVLRCRTAVGLQSGTQRARSRLHGPNSGFPANRCEPSGARLWAYWTVISVCSGYGRAVALARLPLTVLLVSLLVVGCSDRPSARPGTATGLLVAQVHYGSAMVNWPGHGRIQFIADRKVVATAVAAANGRFSVSLTPGRYIARWLKSKKDCRLFHGQIIIVHSATVTRVTLLCPRDAASSR